MGSSRVQVNKPHKSRFSSKSSRNRHKVSLTDKSINAKKDNSVTKRGSAARIQRSKMIREQKRAELLKEKRASSGSTSPPRVIVLFGLSASVNLNALAEDLLSSLSTEDSRVVSGTIASSEYKLRTTILRAPHGDLRSCMEMAKVADMIAFVASASSFCDDDDSYCIDSFGRQCLSVLRSIGLPSTVVFIRDLPTDPKRNHECKRMCISSLTSEFPEDCKFYPADKKDELCKFLWHFKGQRLTLPHWRTQRPYIMAEKVDMVVDGSNPENCTLLLTGYLRACNLSVNQLVHVSGVGDFQMCKVEVLKDPVPLHLRKQNDIMDLDEGIGVEVVRSVAPDPLKQEPLVVENVPDPLAGELTWPTDAEIAEADKMQKQKKMRKRILPRGTSEYQAAWIVDDTDGHASVSDVEAGDGMVLDERDNDIPAQDESTYLDLEDDKASLEYGGTDDESNADTMMMESDSVTKEKVEEELQKIREEHAQDKEFPDEVDTPFDMPARSRFAKYRGLKSFRTSPWDPKESLPPEYARIFAFDNFIRTKKHVLAKAMEVMPEKSGDCLTVGSYARLHIKEVAIDVASRLCDRAKLFPVLVSGLFQHESKISVLHFSVKKHETYDAPIKAKEELIFDIGFRQFVGRPIFSSEDIKSEKYKMERFLHDGTFSIASVFAPISFPPLPLIVLKSSGEGAPPALAAFGSLKTIDPDKIILKRIILTGYPQRVSKSKATVKHMFYNPEDVRWFKPVEVFTKCGLRGRIKEPLGTHGALKCIFNGGLQQNDTVCMNLYKRVYPKWTDYLYGV